MAEFIERNFGDNFYGRKEHEVVFDGNNFEAKKREINREMIESQQRIPMSSVGHFNEHVVNSRRERRTRGRGRKINYKKP